MAFCIRSQKVSKNGKQDMLVIAEEERTNSYVTFSDKGWTSSDNLYSSAV